MAISLGIYTPFPDIPRSSQKWRCLQVAHQHLHRWLQGFGSPGCPRRESPTGHWREAGVEAGEAAEVKSRWHVDIYTYIYSYTIYTYLYLLFLLLLLSLLLILLLYIYHIYIMYNHIYILCNRYINAYICIYSHPGVVRYGSFLKSSQKWEYVWTMWTYLLLSTPGWLEWDLYIINQH